ncbi:AAA-domain-containing protein [Lactarius akahatsu]|uniref:Vesicular-fusion protein SEC18 n=1 Tax=Lactarius akahatsu TaxID=416441 RepID=A0AAD4L7U9_9AGAM|nr:AAA-domain-containing protein [Lactarius akahatsu]
MSRGFFSKRPKGPPGPEQPASPLLQSVPPDAPPPPLAAAPRFAVRPSPTDTLALTNCLIVYPSDFKDGEHVLVNGKFPLTVNAVQRQWIGLVSTGDTVTIVALPAPPHPSAPPFLETLTLEVGFLRRNLDITEVFSVDDMGAAFVHGFGGIAITVGQILVFEHHGLNLRCVVKSVGVPAAEQRREGVPGGGSQTDFGIVMEKTDVTFMKDLLSKIRFKASMRQTSPNAVIAPDFKFEDMGIGGLDREFGTIFRRVFASRMFPPGLVEKLGIQHVKGILLHGPPGTGKTLMARQIGKVLNARAPKIDNDPEILNKYVGKPEENIRRLFEDAEKEYKEMGDESGLHIIIFDELDAIFKRRGSTNSATGVEDTVVNQLLSKMDGVHQLNNVLVIGMTNRIDMIDEALLRPGRFEHGRYQILDIHTTKMRQNGVMDGDVDIKELAGLTKNFSGAAISGLVKSGTSFAFNRHGPMGGISNDVEDLRVNVDDFANALEEVQPAVGVEEEELAEVVQNGIIRYDSVVDELLRSGKLCVEQVRTSMRTPLVSLLLHGPPGTGKTALAATIAQASKFPFIKLITPDNMVGFSEAQKVQAISKVFADSSKSPMSVVIVDNIEHLLDWAPVGPCFSNAVLQTLTVLMAKRPPKVHTQPPITDLTALDRVLEAVEIFRSTPDRAHAVGMLRQAGLGTEEGRLSIGIKRLLSVIEMARQDPEAVAKRLMSSLMGVGM